ncbi:hypothetical protein FB451DRAFT_255211 [Mycena latifolia]|nr:hypothetical protein FB451DRAFT_255211 [Mycena latifolia]
METLRTKILEDEEEPDDLDEMRQFDVATIMAFLHELTHVLWRARWPGLIDTPPKYKALVGSKAKEGEGEGGELIKVAIYGGVMDLIPYDLRGMENARGLFYKAWNEAAEEGLSLVPEYDDEFRCLCSILKGGTQRYYLTRSGAAHMCDVILNAESRNRTYDTIRLVGAFIDLPGPADSTESPLRARSKKRPRILVDSSTVHSISSLTSSSSLAPLSYNPGIKSLPAKTFKLCDQAKGRVHQQATDNKN